MCRLLALAALVPSLAFAGDKPALPILLLHAIESPDLPGGSNIFTSEVANALGAACQGICVVVTSEELKMLGTLDHLDDENRAGDTAARVRHVVRGSVAKRGETWVLSLVTSPGDPGTGPRREATAADIVKLVDRVPALTTALLEATGLVAPKEPKEQKAARDGG